ncbi:hypothetical protein HP532_03925 [Pseudomonas sp. CrR25]|nr:hypothetical protein [Pseudomonas sp. CrR25]
MKPVVAFSLLLSLLATNALALPNDSPMPLLGEIKDSQSEILPQDRHVAEGGAERTPGQQRLRVAEGGAERLLEQRHNG